MDTLWPDENYYAQIDRLRDAIGQQIYLVELDFSEVQLGISMTGMAYTLLDVLHFPRPDPVYGLAPHFLLLSDGRGVNLGRIARVSTRPFAPTATEILYEDTMITTTVLFAPQRLSKALIAERSHHILGQLLGYSMPPQLESFHED